MEENLRTCKRVVHNRGDMARKSEAKKPLKHKKQESQAKTLKASKLGGGASYDIVYSKEIFPALPVLSCKAT